MPKNGFRSFPLIFQWKPKNNNIQITIGRWDPNKKPPGANLFLLIGLNPLLHHLVLLLILNYHNQESNCAQPKKTEVPNQSYVFLFRVGFSNRRDYILTIHVYCSWWLSHRCWSLRTIITPFLWSNMRSFGTGLESKSK